MVDATANRSDPYGFNNFMNSPATADMFKTAMAQYNPQRNNVADSFATIGDLVSRLGGNDPGAVGKVMQQDSERRYQNDWMPRTAAQLSMNNAAQMSLKQQEYDFQRRNYLQQQEYANKAFRVGDQVQNPGQNAAAMANPYGAAPGATPQPVPRRQAYPAQSGPDPVLNGPALTPATDNGGVPQAMPDRKSTRLNSSHPRLSRMPSSA